jgi:hypothetical protein
MSWPPSGVDAAGRRDSPRVCDSPSPLTVNKKQTCAATKRKSSFPFTAIPFVSLNAPGD